MVLAAGDEPTMKNNNANDHNYPVDNPVSGIGTIGIGPVSLKFTGTEQSLVDAGQFAAINRSTPHSLPKSSGVPRAAVTKIQQPNEEPHTDLTEVTSHDFRRR